MEKIQSGVGSWESVDKGLEEKVLKLIAEFDEFMNDDFNTAKVLANMFELVPIINGMKNKQLPENSLSSDVIEQLKAKLKLYIEDILGLNADSSNNAQVDGIIHLLINIRKEAKAKKDFVTGDKIRNELLNLGIQLKDEKDGTMSYSFV